MVGNPHTVESQQALSRLSALPRTSGGQIAANSRCSFRGRRRSPVLAWFDNATGRYFAQHRDRWLTVVPADRHTLEGQLRDLVTEVATDRR